MALIAPLRKNLGDSGLWIPAYAGKACELRLHDHQGTDFLAEVIDRLARTALASDAPISPAIARFEALHMGGDLMDGARRLAGNEAAVCAHLGAVAAR